MSFILVDDRVDAMRGAERAPAPAQRAQFGAAQQVRTAARSGEANSHGTAAKPSALPTSRNRRWSQRSAVRMSGVIGSGSAATAVECAVVDLSKHGAMLELDAAADLPECFVLVFYNRRTRCEANCVVRWRRDGRTGVCFAGPVRSSIGRF